MRNHIARIATVLLVCSAWFPMQGAHAFFEDDEARRHILDLREKKADKASLIELQSQNDSMKQEIADLRGQIEVLTQKITKIESRQEDFYVDLDDRLRRLEGKQPAARTKPGEEAGDANTKVEESDSADSSGTDKPAGSSDDAGAIGEKADAGEGSSRNPEKAGKSVAESSDRTEAADYEVAEKQFKVGNYKGAIPAYKQFIQKYPDSHRLGHAYYRLGNAYYLQKDYKNAYKNQSIILKRFPRNAVAPDAMLNMATCQIGMNNIAGAKKTLTDLTRKYPASSAAKRAKSILAQL